MPALCGLLILVSFLIAIPATLLARGIGRRLNALDGAGVAGQIKAAPRRIPNTGGVGIFLAIALPMLFGLIFFLTAGDDLLMRLHHDLPRFRDGARQQAPAALVLLGGLAILHIVGLIDDRKPLGPYLKLGIMLAVAAAVVILTQSRLLTFLDSSVGGPWLSVLITVLWIVVITNAFNFLDNMDGLSAGVGAICAAFFLATALVGHAPQWFIAATLSLLIGALLGFLLFNFPFKPRTEDRKRGVHTGGASIFMGDSGSLVVGFLLAVLSVRITYVPKSMWSYSMPALPEGVGNPGDAPVPWPVFLVPLSILAIPLYDFTSVCLIRLSQGKSPFVGDLQHFSHRLVRHGLSTRAAVLVIYGCTAITGISAIAIPSLAPWQAALAGVQTLLVLGVLAVYEWKRSPSPG